MTLGINRNASKGDCRYNIILLQPVPHSYNRGWVLSRLPVIVSLGASPFKGLVDFASLTYCYTFLSLEAVAKQMSSCDQAHDQMMRA